MTLTEKLSRNWYDPNKPVPTSLKLLAKLFGVVSQQRKSRFLNSPAKIFRAPLPVIVVGNITVGGTGKTPLVIALIELLKENGISAGVVSRGYGGGRLTEPQPVTGNSKPSEVGDEPVLIALRTNCPVVVFPKRAKAIQTLLSAHTVDVIISDDGMQHYAMARDIEIAVIDGERKLGNGFLIPAGPLREPAQRLSKVDYCVFNGEIDKNIECTQAHSMTLATPLAHILGDETKTKLLLEWHEQTVNAVAGIGNPSRFFNTLKVLGIQVNERSFPDHHAYKTEDLHFLNDFPILMTEKDAVKCQFLPHPQTWVVPVTASLDDTFKNKFVDHVIRLMQKSFLN